MLSKKNTLKTSARTLALILGLSINSSQSMESKFYILNNVDNTHQNEMVLEIPQQESQNNSSKRKPLQKRKVVSKNTVRYEHGNEIIDMIPFEVWHYIFDNLGKSKKSFVEANKSFQCISEKYYGILNAENKYLVWDNRKVWCEFSQRMIYFSNKKIEELVMRDRTVQDYGLDLNDNYMSKLNGIFTLIKNDKFFFKNDNIIKKYSLTIEKSFRTKTSKRQNIKTSSKTINKIEECIEYNHSLEKLLSLNKSNLETLIKILTDQNTQNAKDAVTLTKKTSAHIEKLHKQKSINQEGLRSILQKLTNDLSSINGNYKYLIKDIFLEFEKQYSMNKQYMKILYHYLLYSIDCEPRTESILIETPSFAEKLAKSEEIIDVLVKKIDNLNNDLSTAKSDAIKVVEEFRELLKSPDLQERCTHYKGDLIAQLMLEFSYKMKLQSISDLIPNPHTSYMDPNTPFFWYSPFNPLLIKVLKDNQELSDLREKEQPTTQDLQRIIDLEDYPLADDLRELARAYNVDGKILESDIYSIRVIEEVGENATLRDLRWATNAYMRTKNISESDKCSIRVIEKAKFNATLLDIRSAAYAYNRIGRFHESDLCSIRVIVMAGDDVSPNDLRWASNAYSRAGNFSEDNKCKIRLIKHAEYTPSVDELRWAAESEYSAGHLIESNEFWKRLRNRAGENLSPDDRNKSDKSQKILNKMTGEIMTNLQTELLLPYYGKALAHLNDASETEEYENLDQIMQNPDDSIDAYNWQ